MFNFLKKLFYLCLAAYLAFLVTSILFGGGMVRDMGEKLGLPYFDKLAEEGDAIKHKTDSLFGRGNGAKERGEDKGRLVQ